MLAHCPTGWGPGAGSGNGQKRLVHTPSGPYCAPPAELLLCLCHAAFSIRLAAAVRGTAGGSQEVGPFFGSLAPGSRSWCGGECP